MGGCRYDAEKAYKNNSRVFLGLLVAMVLGIGLVTYFFKEDETILDELGVVSSISLGDIIAAEKNPLGGTAIMRTSDDYIVIVKTTGENIDLIREHGLLNQFVIVKFYANGIQELCLLALEICSKDALWSKDTMEPINVTIRKERNDDISLGR